MSAPIPRQGRSRPPRRRSLLPLAALSVATALLVGACGSSGSTAGSSTAGSSAAGSTTSSSSMSSGTTGSSSVSDSSTSATPSGSGTGAPAADGETLRYVAVGAPASAINDPHGGVINQSDLAVFSLTYDVLTAPGKDGTTELRLATKITPDATGTKWTVTLRDDATFTDGSAVTADDVLFSLRRILAKKAENFGRMTMFDLDASKAVDKHTLLLVTTAPYYEVPRALESVTYVVPAGTQDFSSLPIGSGPFRIVSRTPDTTVLERNDSWWGTEPSLARIEIRAVIDPRARAQAVLGGQADVAQTVDIGVVRQIEGRSDLQAVRHRGVQSYPIVMRMDTAPFDDPRVREAFKLAANRQQLVAAAFQGLGTPSGDILAPYDPGAPDKAAPAPDLDKARQLLAEAGHADGLDLELFTTSSYPGMPQAATVFAQQLAGIGVRAKVTVAPPDSFFTEVYNVKPFYTGFFGGIPFLDMARVSLLSTAPANDSRWVSPEWDKAFAAALATRDDAARRTALGALQQQIADDGGYLVWGHGDIVDLASSRVQGLPDGPGFAGSFIDQVSMTK